MFFAATKLFQARDPHLRRMVYLLIKVHRAGSWACSGHIYTVLGAVEQACSRAYSGHIYTVLGAVEQTCSGLCSA